MAAVESQQAQAGPSKPKAPTRPTSPRPGVSPLVPLSSLPPQGTPIHEKPTSWDFYRDVLGSPKYIVAPMVSASELPWRILSREFGADLCYSPMINSGNLVVCLGSNKKGAKQKQKAWFDAFTGEEGHGKDEMLVAQLAGNDPETLLQAAQYVQDHCLAVDLNLGCPQRIAKRGHYGSWLQEDWPLIFRLINILHLNLKVPVTAKMRVFPDVETTVAYAKMLQHAGAQIVTVHGRTREQKGHKTGLADWEKIRAVKEALDVPVFANGNILYGDDLANALEKTGADGVMSAEGNLYTPTIFSSPSLRATYGEDLFPYLNDTEHPEWSALPYIPRLANMYLDKVVDCKTTTAPVAIKGHMFKVCKPALDKHRDLMIKIGQAQVKPVDEKDVDDREAREASVKEYRDAIKLIEERLENDRKDPSYLTAPADQVEMPPEYRFAPHWLAQPYFRPGLPHDAGPGAMVDPADEQSRGEKRALEGEEPSTTEEKKIRLAEQLEECEEVKSQGNALFARKEYDEACVAWMDAVGVLPPVQEGQVEAQVAKGKGKEGTEAITELTEEEAEQMQAELEDVHLLALRDLQRKEKELRTMLWSNVAEARLRLEQWQLAKEACDNALHTTPTHLKSLSRRATATEHLSTHSSLSQSLSDLQTLQSRPDLPSSQVSTIQSSITRVQQKQREAMEREKDEMLDKLKGLGNSILGKFGLSTDNFKFEQNEQGSWGMKFQR